MAPFLQLTGIASEVQEKDASFNLQIHQYTRLLNDKGRLHVTVEAPSHWTNPTLPENGTIVSTWGPLLDVIIAQISPSVNPDKAVNSKLIHLRC